MIGLLLALPALAAEPTVPVNEPLLLALAADDPDDARARELYDNGAILYEEGRYEDAIAAWEEAYRLSGRPLLLFNIANALERLGRYDEAMVDLSRYRAFAPAEERETLDRRIRNLELRIDEQKAAPPVVTTTTTTAAPERTSSVRVLPFVLGGVGLAATAGGVVFGVEAMGARKEAAALCQAAGGSTWCGEDAASALAADRRDSLLADVGFGLGALGIGGAIVTALVPGHSTSLGGGVGPGVGWLTVGGHF